MSTPVFNNGLFLRDNNIQVGSHLDSNHLLSMMKDAKPQDLGPVDIWAMAQKVEMPIYQMSSFGGKNVIPVHNAQGHYTWQTPLSQDLPYIVEDIEPNNVSKGSEGHPFKIKLNNRDYGHNRIITYDKYNGVQLIVTDDDIIPTGDGYIYTVQIANNNNFKTFDNKFLKQGTKFFDLGSARSGEYGERFDEISVRTGFREFYNYVGNAHANVHYTISTQADKMIKAGLNADGTQQVVEIWRNFDKNIDPSLSSIESMVGVMGKDYIKKAIANGSLQRSYITKLEAACLTKISRDTENYLMWGQGGTIRGEGPDSIRLSVGLWKQLDNSHKRVYNKSNFSIDLFRSELFNFFNGKVEFQGPDPKRSLVIQTGMGGMRMVNEAILRYAVASGLNINASAGPYGIGAITNQGMNLGFGFAYTSFIVPFLANIQFVLNPAFDNVHTNDIENPIIDGHPLSSYSFIIFDVTENVNDNIYLLKLSWDNELNWWYQNGQADYNGSRGGFSSSGQFSGYRVYMTQRYPAIWVKDPTKVLKIVMRNPITGGSL
jgi:hypothetical protein